MKRWRPTGYGRFPFGLGARIALASGVALALAGGCAIVGQDILDKGELPLSEEVARSTVTLPTDGAIVPVTNTSGYVVDQPGGSHTLGETKFAVFEPETGKGRLCDRTDVAGTFDTSKQEICGAADLRANEAEDGRDLPCDAVFLRRKGGGRPGPARRSEIHTRRRLLFERDHRLHEVSALDG